LLFSKPKKAIGLDIGSHSVKAVQMSRSGGRLYIDEVGYAVVNREQANADPVMAHASAVSEALRTMATAQSAIVGALPGQTVVIRYPRLPESAKDQLENAIEREAGQNIPYDLNEVLLDWTLLDELEEGDQRQLKVLLVAAKHEVIDSRVQILDACEVQCSILGVDSLALADAAEACDFLRVGETVAMLNIGLTSASLHFIKDGVSNFIRDVSWGSRELIQSIAKEKRVDYDEAERMLKDAAHDFEAEPGQESEPAEAEPLEATPMDADPFGEVDSGSLLDPLDEEMSDVTGSAVPMAGMAAEKTVGDVIAHPLNRMVSEIRRSFDYYEHQLYERPVDRLIISGGVAHLPMLRAALLDELGVEMVEVADPTVSALTLGDDSAVSTIREQPAQFIVAVGLAARGMAEL
jgi:type IV pilus assembly protein PilM